MQFSKEIINWFLVKGRDLPWRKTKNPYFIWLSETILQQTRVEQGLPYYLKFTTQFPTIKSLANAHEDDVLKLWQGLGYYSRARNLHFTAKYIVNELNGKFPSNYKTLLLLKGVGDYTASAIASFCFKENTAVVDGNVYRVLSRLFGIETPIDSTQGKKDFKLLAQELLHPQHPDRHNQAIMEFGALQCVPKNPDCENCPLLYKCVAYREKKIGLLPIKSKKIKQRNRFFNYLYITHNNAIYIQKREEKDIWQNLFQLPLIETDKKTTIKNLLNSATWKTIFSHQKIQVRIHQKEIKHVLSHQKIYAQFFEIELSKELENSFLKIPLHTLQDYAFPVLITNFLQERIAI